jgi:hypothetical protein
MDSPFRRRPLVFGLSAYPPLWELTGRPRYDAADASAAISRDTRLARRDHTTWAAAARIASSASTATAPTGRVSPDRSRKPWRRISDATLRPSPHLSALERALGWDEVMGV